VNGGERVRHPQAARLSAGKEAEQLLDIGFQKAAVMRHSYFLAMCFIHGVEIITTS
jgi:hypothetical protein